MLSLQQQGWRPYTPETRKLCAEKCAKANERGRAAHGQSWAPDMQVCDIACPTCQREVAAGAGL